MARTAGMTPTHGGLALPEKPSVAVLPFHNLTGDPEQEYFADGMADDLTTALSRFKSLFVIARNSSFTYKGKSVDTRQVGRELGVRYVLEGSVRKAGHRVRISGQLVEASTGAQLWADRIDGSLEDIFELQDSVTAKVVGAIAQSMDSAETERAKRKPLESLDAYDCHLRGMACLRDQTREKTEEALALARRAIGYDAGFIPAYGLVARCHALRWSQGWIKEKDTEADKAEIRRMAAHVSAQGQDDAFALAQTGQAMAWVCQDVETARAMIDAALALNQNLANAWAARAHVSGLDGEHETTLKQADMALRLSPLDSERHLAEIQMAWGNLMLHRYDEAIIWAQRTVSHRPNAVAAWSAMIVAMAKAGRLEDASALMERVLKIVPQSNSRYVRKMALYRRPEDVELIMDGFRLAGLPD
jgi:TolB-like protein